MNAEVTDNLGLASLHFGRYMLHVDGARPNINDFWRFCYFGSGMSYDMMLGW